MVQISQQYKDYLTCLETMTMCQLSGLNTKEELGEGAFIEASNFISSYEYEKKKDTPAKTWWNAKYSDVSNKAVSRALRIDRKQKGAVYALSPFKLWHDGEKHLIIAAYPAPRILGILDLDHLLIQDVIAWNPVDDTVQILGDENPRLIGPNLTQIDNPKVFASPREFLTAWAIERAQFFVRWTTHSGNKWQEFKDVDVCPGNLAIGPLDKIRWSGMPRGFEAVDIEPHKLNKAILRQAKVPRAFANQKRDAA